MLIFFSFLISLLGVDSLIVFDKHYYKVSPHRLFSARVYLMEFSSDINYFPNARQCDLQSYGHFMFCDMLMYSQVCLVASSLEEPNYYQNRPTFLVDENMEIKDTADNNMECSVVNKKYFPPNLAGNSTLQGHWTSINVFEGTFYDLLIFTVYIGDHKFEHYWTHTKNYQIFVSKTFAIHPIIRYITQKRFIDYIEFMVFHIFHVYQFEFRCPYLHYGRTCSLKCTDNHRQICQCRMTQENIYESCKVQCNPGWIGSYDIYTLDDVEESFQRCTSRDLCYKDDKKCPSICLPIDNTTYICENIKIIIQINSQKAYTTSKIIFVGEILTISVDRDIIKNKFVATNISLTYLSSHFFREKLFRRINGSKDISFLVEDTEQIDKPFNFTYFIHLPAWEKNITKTNEFLILIRPTEINVSSDWRKDFVRGVVYTGQMLRFISNGKPKSKMKYEIGITYQSKIITIPSNRFQIPNTFITGILRMNVTAKMSIEERNNIYVFKSFIYYLKAFITFTWFPEKNVFSHYDSLKCIHDSYIETKASIFQADGPSIVNPYDDFVDLPKLKGGNYELLCIVIFPESDFTLMKRIRFQLRTIPDQICLFINPNTVGSIVQCSHSGTIYDEYVIDVELLTFDVDWNIIIQARDYLRIPYNLDTSKYVIKCVVSHAITMNKVLSTEFKKKLSYEPQGIYPKTLSSMECATFADYVEKPDISKYLKDGILMNHFLFYFRLSHSDVIPILSVYTLYIFIYYILLIIIIKIKMGYVDRQKYTILTVRKILRNMKRRRINDKLLYEVIKKTTAKNDVLERFFKINFDSKRSSSRALPY